jgi:hypothetical protein
MLFTFDPPETGWTLGGSVNIVSDGTAPSPPNVLSLGIDGFARRTLSGLTVGHSYPMYVWCNFDNVSSETPEIRVSYNNTFVFGGNPLPRFHKNGTDPLGWEFRYIGDLPYFIADRLLSFQPFFSTGENVLVDSIFLAEDVAKRSRFLAHQRLITVLRGINGAGGGYHIDLGNRVFTKYIRPVGSTHPALPYICVPLVNSNPRVEHDNTWLRHTWTLPIMVFVSETNVGAYDSDALAPIYHLGEDVFQAVMKDPTLNGTVASVSFISGGIDEAGISPFDGMPYADSIIPLDLSIFLGLDVLGP